MAIGWPSESSARRSQIVLGLDPDPGRLWPDALRLAADRDTRANSGTEDELGRNRLGHEADSDAATESPAARAGRAVAAHCALVIQATSEECVAVKLQVACFERLGAPGWTALADTVALARDHGLLVIADAKRGDVEVTAAAYAQAFLGETATPFGPVPGLGADAMTVNPLLGLDSLEPFVNTARAHGRGLFVLVRTSNPGAADVQEAALADGGAVSERLAAIVDQVGAGGVGADGSVRRRRGRRRHRPRPSRGTSRADAPRPVPAARNRGPGWKRRGSWRRRSRADRPAG